MKFSNALWASALLAGAASASAHHRRHHHPLLKRTLNDTEAATCLPKCTTYVTSYLVDVEEPTPAPVPEPTPTTPPVEVVTVNPIPENPIVEVTVCPTPGTYTIPATTVTITQTEAVCVPGTTDVPAGTHTVGGITTVVETQTTIVCPIATTKTVDGTITSVVEQTTFVCPTPGTYTIGPITTVVPEPTQVTYPVVSTVLPGTYCHEEIVTVIDVTSYVLECPLTTVEVTATVVPVAPTEAPKPPPKQEAPKPKPETPSPPKGDKPLRAITYSPFNDDSGCKSGADVDRDIADIASKGFSSIRLYSPECDSLKTVGGACEKYGIKIILGVFIKAGGVTTADKEVEAIKAWKKWNLVDIIVVGNEAVFNGFCTAHELATYIRKVAGELRGIGYGGKITTTETVNIIEQHGDVLCGAVDIVGVNIHPYFDPNVAPSDAGPFLNTQLSIVEKKCGKPGVVLEAGWPSRGLANGKARPGPGEQAEAINSIKKNCDLSKITWFTYRDDPWKPEGPLGVESHFGCGNLF